MFARLARERSTMGFLDRSQGLCELCSGEEDRRSRSILLRSTKEEDVEEEVTMMIHVADRTMTPKYPSVNTDKTSQKV